MKLTFNAGATQAELLVGVREVLAATLPDWLASAKELDVSPLLGGMSNTVYKCTAVCGSDNSSASQSPAAPPPVLLRCYGSGSDIFCARKDELLALKAIAKHSLGPAVLGEFGNGRVEQFLSGRTLEAGDIRLTPISLQIAATVARLHKLDIPELQHKSVLPRLLRSLSDKALKTSGEVHKGIHVRELTELSQGLIDFLKPIASPVVFCHNDLQHGNILYDDSTSTVQLIDYEYSGYNVRGFDLGNHFCEWMANYATSTPHVVDVNLFPTKEERLAFMRAYLGQCATTESAEALDNEAMHYALASHLMWALWGVIESTISEIDFDYAAYAQQRIEAFHHFEGVMGVTIPRVALRET